MLMFCQFEFVFFQVRALTTQSIKHCNQPKPTDPETTKQQSGKSVGGSANSIGSDKQSGRVPPSEKYRLRGRTVESKIDTGRSRRSEKSVSGRNPELPVVEVKTSNRKEKFVRFFDVFVHLFQVLFDSSHFSAFIFMMDIVQLKEFSQFSKAFIRKRKKFSKSISDFAILSFFQSY
jgi:hypothetical protein